MTQATSTQPIKNALLEAHDLIFGDREKTYGDPTFTYTTVAELWRIYLERKHNCVIALLPEDVCQMMVLLKVARLMNTPNHRDSLVDLAGYAGLQDRIQNSGVMQEPLFKTGVVEVANG